MDPLFVTQTKAGDLVLGVDNDITIAPTHILSNSQFLVV
jgi:hypothetical protein